jgi:putative PIN family toxin of toxin-antitoxin system
VRLVLDTNTVVSGLLWQGLPGKLIDAAQEKSVSLYTSAPLLAELRGVLERAKFARQLESRGLDVVTIFDGFAALASIVTPAIITPAVANDPADDSVLACALAAQVDLVVSGDTHLLGLKTYHGIPIVTAAEALLRLSPQ